LHALRPVIGVPHLRRNKNVPARNPPAASPSFNALPTSRSFPYRSAQSKCRNPASKASLVAEIVNAGSGINVPKPSVGIRPAPWLRAILVIRRSEDSIMATHPIYFASGITANSKVRYRVPQAGR
jgi:hypothetical protein